MKTIILLLVTFGFVTTTALAQFWSLPPSSTVNGLSVQPIGANAGSTHWESLTSLGAYATTGDGYGDPLLPGAIDAHRGLTWQLGASAGALAAKNALNTNGGFVRVVFVGETAGWLNDFGYSLSGKPSSADSYTVFQNIQTIGPDANMHFGQYLDIPLHAGAANAFDFWYNSVGDFGVNTPAVQTGRGGIYTAFNPSNGEPASFGDQFLWARDPLSVNTWLPSLGTYSNVATYLVGVEDWRNGTGSDRDYSDFRFGLQFFDASGNPLGQIPEPAMTALGIGAFALLACAFRRRQVGLATVA